MKNRSLMRTLKAHCASAHWAFSLLELISVIAMIGLLALAAGTYLGNSSLANSGAEGFTRKLALALNYARRATISTGDNHYLQLATSSGSVISYSLYRRDSGGDVQVDDTHSVPTDVVVTSAQTTLEYDFDGSALAAYLITVAGPDRSWVVTVVPLTGAVQVSESP